MIQLKKQSKPYYDVLEFFIHHIHTAMIIFQARVQISSQVNRLEEPTELEAPTEIQDHHGLIENYRDIQSEISDLATKLAETREVRLRQQVRLPRNSCRQVLQKEIDSLFIDLYSELSYSAEISTQLQIEATRVQQLEEELVEKTNQLNTCQIDLITWQDQLTSCQNQFTQMEISLQDANEKITALEEYCLNVDHHNIPVPDKLSYLFQRDDNFKQRQYI